MAALAEADLRPCRIAGDAPCGKLKMTIEPSGRISKVEQAIEAFEAAHAFHADVQHDAALQGITVVGKERLCRRPAARGDAACLELPGERAADGLVVVDDVGERDLCHPVPSEVGFMRFPVRRSRVAG